MSAVSPSCLGNTLSCEVSRRSRKRVLITRLVARTIAVAIAFALTQSTAFAQIQPGATYIGKLTPFYRASQLQASIPGQGLIDIPTYLTDGRVDIQYSRKPGFSREVPFADTFSLTRFLGGFREDWLKPYNEVDPALGQASLDYVIRRDGKLVTRPEIITQHLKPYLDAGYKLCDVTINMENVPWALARGNGDAGDWGQRNPPADPADWKWMVAQFAKDLKSLYGGSCAPNFKIGNEYDSKKSFNGSPSDYFDLYQTSYEVLHGAFPDSEIAPGEFTGQGTCTNSAICVYDTRDFLERASSLGMSPSYVPRSLNGFQNTRKFIPNAIMPIAAESYRRLGNVVPEIHQFGLMGQPFGTFNQFGSDQGARQAAWEFDALMDLQDTLRPRRIFHWESFDNIPAINLYLLNGTGFVNLILDRYLGAAMYRLDVRADDDPTSETDAVEFKAPGHDAIVIANFSADTGSDAIHVSLPVSGGRPDLRNWRYVRYSANDNVSMAVRRDLAADGNLKPDFERCATCTAQTMHMAVDPMKARTMLTAHRAAYEQIVQDGLKWKAANLLSYATASNGSFEFNLPRNEVLVLEMTH